MIKVIKFLFLLPILGLFASCEGYLDINDDPNQISRPPIRGLLATTTYRIGGTTQSVGGFTSFFVQYLASPNPSGASDVHDDVSYDATWASIYNNLANLADLEILAEEVNATDYVAVAKIMKAMNMSLAIDQWGDVPYSEAFFATTLTPSFDEQTALYNELFVLLDDAIALLDAGGSAVSLGEEDFIYNGNVANWTKLAHGLKARFYLRASNTPGFNTEALLTSVSNSFTSNSEDAQVTYFTPTNQRNPWATVAINNAALLLGGWISEQIVEAMDGTTFGLVDPRMPEMFGTTNQTLYPDLPLYRGTENGAGRGTDAERGMRSTLVEGTFYSSQESPILLLTYAELKFIEAEAALGVNTIRAYDAYLEGIEAHMTKLGIGLAEREAYINDPSISVGSANLTLAHIMKEKYIAMFLSPEAWVDARRYDYQYEDMTLPENHNDNLGGQFLRRVRYTDSEIARNSGNVPTNITLLTRLWWDQ